MRRFIDLGGLWVLGQGVIFALYTVALFFDDGVLSGVPWWCHAPAGLGLFLAGSAFILSAMAKLGRNLTPFPAPVENNRLVHTGPFALVRHPIYCGIVLGFVGGALVVGRLAPLTISALMLGFFALKSASEERALAARHPEYGAYQQQVRWRVIPFVV